MEKEPHLAPIIRNIEFDWTGPIQFTRGQTVDFWQSNAFTGFPDHGILGPCTSNMLTPSILHQIRWGELHWNTVI